MTLFASSNTLDGIRACIIKFYCGTDVQLEPDGAAWKVIRTSDGKHLDSVRVIKSRGRYRFIRAGA